MELIVISGLALLGYELSKDNKTPRKRKVNTIIRTTRQPDCNKFPFADKKTTQNDFLEQNTPFFTERKVSSNSTQKQRTMESFTGTDTENFWQKKKEVENLFAPHKGLSNMHGSTSTSSAYGSDRYSGSLTQKMDGVAPIEKMQVGRGLNKGSGSVASGGFHDSTRILPENLNSYKKNSFAGRTLAGKGVNNMRNTAPHIENNEKPERFYTDKDRKLAPTKSQVNKEQQRSEVILNCANNRDNCNEMVHLGAVAPETLGHTLNTNGTRTYDSTKCNTTGNPHAQVLGNNPQHGSYVMPTGEREDCGTVTNAHYSGHGGSNQYSDAANPTLREDKNNYEGQAYNSRNNATGNNSTYTVNPTMREDKNNYEGQAHNSQINMGGHISNKFTANPTMREDKNNYEGQAYNSRNNATGNNSTYTANSTTREETGGNNHENAPKYNNGQSSRKYESNPTQRQSTHSSYTGVANSKNKGNSNQYAMRTAQPFRKREDVQQEFIPNGGRMNVREDAIAVNGAVHLPTDCNSHPVNHGIHNQASSVNQLGNIEFANRGGSHNPRNDFNLAKNILKTNQFSQSII